MRTSIVFAPCLVLAVNAADNCKDNVMPAYGAAFQAAQGALTNLVDDSHMCQYVSEAHVCEAKATEQDCTSGGQCEWSSTTSKCSFPGDKLMSAIFSFPAASAGGKLFEKGQACAAIKTQSDCSDSCVWDDSESECGLDFGSMCSDADVDSVNEAVQTCQGMTPPSCSGDCEEKTLSNGATYCGLMQSSIIEGFFGDTYAQKLKDAMDDTANCPTNRTADTFTCPTGCTKNVFGCAKRGHPIMTKMVEQSSSCKEATEKAKCSSPCEWRATGEGGSCEVSNAWGNKECKAAASFALSSFKPVSIFLSIIVLSAAGCV